MTLTEIRSAVIARMAAQTAIPTSDVTYPNDTRGTFDPKGKPIWARLTNIPGLAEANEIGKGPVVHRTGTVIIQIFVPVHKGTVLITQTADQLRELFEWQNDGGLSYFSVSSVEVGESDGWYQQNITIPYRAI